MFSLTPERNPASNQPGSSEPDSVGVDLADPLQRWQVAQLSAERQGQVFAPRDCDTLLLVDLPEQEDKRSLQHSWKALPWKQFLQVSDQSLDEPEVPESDYPKHPGDPTLYVDPSSLFAFSTRSGQAL